MRGAGLTGEADREMSSDDTVEIEAKGLILPLDPDYPVAEVLDDGKTKRLLAQKWPRFLKACHREMPRHVHFVGLYDQPGSLLFCNQVETRYFWPPGTPSNDPFRFHRALWFDKEWVIVSFPKKVERFGPRVAERLGLVVERGFPTIVDIRGSQFAAARSKRDLLSRADSVVPFPLHGENVFTIDYPKGGKLAGLAATETGWRLMRAAELHTIRQTGDRMKEQERRN
jgi:hypothetical protein